MFTEESFRAVRDRLSRTGCSSSTTTSASAGSSIGWRTRPLSRLVTSRACTCTRRSAYLGRHPCRAATGDADERPGRAGSRHSVRTVARAQPGADSSSRSGDRAGDRRLAVPLPAQPSPAAPLRLSPSSLILGVSAVVVFATLRGQEGRLVVAVLPARRRVHAPRNEIDHPVCAVMGLDLGCRLAGHCRRADDGASGELDRVVEWRSRVRGWWAEHSWRCSRSTTPSRSAG